MNVQQMMNENEPRRRSHIAINLKEKIKLIALDDIYYFKAENKYIIVNSVNGQYLISGTLNDLEADLDERFIRIHRNALVSTRYLESLEKNEEGRWCVLFEGIGDKLEISRRQTPKIRRWLKSGVKH